MKKNALLAILLSLPLALKANSVNLDLSTTASPLGTASQSAAIIYGLDSTLTYTTATLRQLQSDASGNLKVAGTFSGGTFVMGSNTAVSQGTSGTSAWPVYITATSVPQTISSPAFTVTTHTASSVNLTFTGGVNGPIQSLYVVPGDGGAALRYLVTLSGTAPSDLARRGNYIITTATTQVTGPFPAGAQLHMIGIGSASVYTGIQVMQ